MAVGLICLALGQSACGAAAVTPTVAEGRSLYQEHGCANCHGSAGRGDGPVGNTLAPKPRDFRDAAAFRNGIDVRSIAATLAEGIADSGSRMPRFDHLTEQQRRSLALFVVSLREDSDGRPAQAAVIAREAWVREPLASRMDAALFVVLENRSSETRFIVSAAADAAANVEMHAMKMTGSMMAMSRVDRIELMAKATTELKPGASHIMLFGLTQRPVAGESITAALTLDNGAVVLVKADVRKQETTE